MYVHVDVGRASLTGPGPAPPRGRSRSRRSAGRPRWRRRPATRTRRPPTGETRPADSAGPAPASGCSRGCRPDTPDGRPSRVQVIEHDLPADRLEAFFGDLLGQFLVALRRQLGEFLTRGRGAQQRIPSIDDDGALLGDQLVVAPGVRVHVEHAALGDPLGMVEQPGRLGAGDPAVLVGFHRQLVVVQVCRHDVVFPTGEEHRRPGVALAPGAPAQLVVNRSVWWRPVPTTCSPPSSATRSWSASSEPRAGCRCRARPSAWTR